MDGHTPSFAALVIVATAAFLIPIVVRRIRFLRVPCRRRRADRRDHHRQKRSRHRAARAVAGVPFDPRRRLSHVPLRSGDQLWPARQTRFLTRRKKSVCAVDEPLLAARPCWRSGGFLLTRLGLVHNPWLIALILSTVSVGVVLPMLKEKQLVTTEYGQTILVTALLLDFGTMILLTVLVTMVLGGKLEELGLIGLLFVAVALVYAGGRRYRRSPLMKELAHATSQIGVRGAFMLIFVLAFLSESLGVEVILGAFLAGAIVSLIAQSDETSLHLKLDAIGFGFLVPIFFIMVGVEFDLAALLARPEAVVLALAVLVAAYAS